MCCTIRTRGTSEAECLTSVVDKTDCTITWGGHTYGEDNGLCGSCNSDNSCAAISPDCNNSPNCGTNCALGCRLGAESAPRDFARAACGTSKTGFGEQPCDVFPARDSSKAISFSKEIL